MNFTISFTKKYTPQLLCSYSANSNNHQVTIFCKLSIVAKNSSGRLKPGTNSPPIRHKYNGDATLALKRMSSWEFQKIIKFLQLPPQKI